MPITKINSLGITYPVSFSAGTASLPSITFSGDTNTGVFTAGADIVSFTTGGTERVRMNNSELTITSGNLKCLGTFNNTTGSPANVVVDSAGGYARTTSSLKYKRDIQDATHGLTKVMELRSITYKSKSENDKEKIFGGLIAEEIHKIGLTEFVQYAEDGSPDSIAYGNMVSLAFKAIQEQQAIIEELKARLTALESK